MTSPVSVHDEFVRRRTADIRLRDGARIRVRPVVPDDKERLVQGLERLSPRSRYRRFMSAVTRLRPDQLAYFTELDYIDHFALGAVAVDDPGSPGVGVVRYVRFPGEPDVAEPAIVIADEYQGRGLGTLLFRLAAGVALENGIRTFRAEALADNLPVRKLLYRCGARGGRGGSPAVYTVDLAALVESLQDTELYPVITAIARGEAGPAE